MLEIKSLRDYRKKVVVNDENKTQVYLYPADIFYNNKLGEGDGVLGFREWDLNLVWIDSPRRGWTFRFHNYQPFLPEFADEWFGYRDLYQGKDQSFAFKPRNALHVAGRLVPNIPNVTPVNAVIYDDAFGTGIDLIIKFTGHAMQKLVRIREGFYPAVDTDFDFELRFPEGVNVYEKNMDTKEMTTLDPLAPKVLSARSQIYIGTDQADGKDWFTRVNPVRIWDSGVAGNGTGQKVNLTPAAIVVTDNKTFLRKRVLASFFTNAVGDVFTDATVNYYENKDTYYGTVFTTGGAPNAETLNIGGWGDFYYSYLEFDLTGSPTSEMVSAVSLSLRVNGAATNDSTSSIRRVTSSWTEAGVTSSNVPTDAGATDAVALTNPVTVGAGNRDEKSVLTYYNNWKNGTWSNFGFKLHSTTNNDAAHTYSSSDHSGGQSNYPYLILTLVDDAYTRGGAPSVPSGTAPEEVVYSAGDKTDVSSDNAVRVTASGTPVILHLFKKRSTDPDTYKIVLSWNGQCSTAPSSKIVKLQIYNFVTPAWVDVDSDNATAANTDFTLSGEVVTNASQYYDDNNYVYVRVVQDIT